MRGVWRVKQQLLTWSQAKPTSLLVNTELQREESRVMYYKCSGNSHNLGLSTGLGAGVGGSVMCVGNKIYMQRAVNY